MITVIGSINMDLSVGTNSFPNQGETVLGEFFKTVPGGKGANHAVAASRLGSEVLMKQKPLPASQLFCSMTGITGLLLYPGQTLKYHPNKLTATGI